MKGPHRASMELWLNHRRKDEKTMDAAVIAAIEELRALNVGALKKRYQELLGSESKSSNKQFLFRRIAWRLQANSEGDLSERARRRAAEIVNDIDLRVRAPRDFMAGYGSGADRLLPGRDWRLPRPGTLLTRRLNDRQIVVKVLEDGFEYQSRHYRSLSAIAREATGTRWNGMVFFGLTERRSA